MSLLVDLGPQHVMQRNYALALIDALHDIAPERTVIVTFSGADLHEALITRQRLSTRLPSECIHYLPLPAVEGDTATQVDANARARLHDTLVSYAHAADEPAAVIFVGRFVGPQALPTSSLPLAPPAWPQIDLSEPEQRRAHGLDALEEGSLDDATRQALHKLLADLAAMQEQEGSKIGGEVVEGDTHVALPSASARPRLAFVSPLPPMQTGIADYSLELLDALAPYYHITLIVHQDSVTPKDLHQRYAIRQLPWFHRYGQAFDRVLYHWGNSVHHTHMVDLLQRFPGTVVLHDVYSGDIMYWLAMQEDNFASVLYSAHGYSALAAWHQQPIREVLRHYPLNHAVISLAKGVLVHSRHALALAEPWLTKTQVADWQYVPFLRLVHHQLEDHASRRAAARKALGISEEAFIICTFGLITANKCVLELLEAFHYAGLSGQPEVQIIAVGGYGDETYQQKLLRWLSSQVEGGRVSITGYVDAEDYRHYLDAADIGVQLRTHSRGETSAAVYDCLAAGLPLIANAHGSVNELPDDVVIRVADPIEVSELGAALEALYHHPERRRAQAERAWQYVSQQHGAAVVGARYFQAIERAHRTSEVARYEQLIHDLGHIVQGEGIELDQAATQSLAYTIDLIRPMSQPPRLLIDVSNISNHDLKTGIERVTRNLCEIFLHTPPAGYRVELIRSLGGEWHYARGYAAERLGLEAFFGEDEAITPREEDIYLSLEWSPPVLASMYKRFQAMRALGVKLYFTVFDALPMQFPHHFPDFVQGTYEDWFSKVLRLADGLCCISAAVADDIRTYAYKLPEPLRPKGELPTLGHFHLGADFTARAASQGLRPEDHATLEKLTGEAPILLMVGTLEPRKGHTQVINAMEHLWQQGSQARLVIVGKLGWKMDAMAKRLNEHPEQGKRLFWVEGASDDMLSELYRTSTALVASSEGEGFGLPLIEAAQRGIKIIARDIPVFREVAGAHASYFHSTDGEGLAQELNAWFKADAAGQTPSVEDMPWLSWEQSAQQLLRLVLPPR